MNREAATRRLAYELVNKRVLISQDVAMFSVEDRVDKTLDQTLTQSDILEDPESKTEVSVGWKRTVVVFCVAMYSEFMTRLPFDAERLEWLGHWDYMEFSLPVKWSTKLTKVCLSANLG